MYIFGGSLGKVSYETDLDILRVLKDHEGSLPRHVRANIIMRDVDRYWFGYSKCNPQPGKSKYGCVKYSPPKDGGSFHMPEICLTRHQVLADFQYIKMWTVMIIDSLNKHRKINDHQPVATGPIQYEFKTIWTHAKEI